MSITADESHKEFKIQRIYELSVSPSNWKMGEDYALDVKVTPAGSTESRTVALGKTINGKGQTWESTKNTCIFAVGDTVEAAAASDAVKHPNSNPATLSNSLIIQRPPSATLNHFATVV